MFIVHSAWILWNCACVCINVHVHMFMILLWLSIQNSQMFTRLHVHIATVHWGDYSMDSYSAHTIYTMYVGRHNLFCRKKNVYYLFYSFLQSRLAILKAATRKSPVAEVSLVLIICYIYNPINFKLIGRRLYPLGSSH